LYNDGYLPLVARLSGKPKADGYIRLHKEIFEERLYSVKEDHYMMSSAVRGANDYNDDEDQWLEMIKHISGQNSVISHNGIYDRPESFSLEGVSFGDSGYFNEDFPI
jgi:hypothetical protein